jgi:hypothetical protein
VVRLQDEGIGGRGKKVLGRVGYVRGECRPVRVRGVVRGVLKV